MKFYPLKPKSPIPLYVQLSDIIKRNIDEGILQEQDLIPSESKLMAEYNVSRITVRNALLRLEHDNEILKVHGRGSFVASKDQLMTTSPFDFFIKEMKARGMDVSSRFIEFLDVYPPETVRSSLELSHKDMVTKIKTLIVVSGKNIGIRLFFLPRNVAEGIKNTNIENLPLLDYLNSKTQTRVTKMDIAVQAGIIGDTDAEIMKVDNGSTVLIRKIVFKNNLDLPVLYGRIIYLSQSVVIKMSVKLNSAEPICSIKELPIKKTEGTYELEEDERLKKAKV